MPLPDINANDNRLAEVAACLFHQLAVFHGGGAQDDTVYPGFKQLLYCFQLADAASHLGGD